MQKLCFERSAWNEGLPGNKIYRIIFSIIVALIFQEMK